MTPNVTITAKGVPGLEDSPRVLQVPHGSTLAWLLDRLAERAGEKGSPNERRTLRNVIVTLNGRYVPVAELDARILQDGDRVEIMPLLVGG